MCQACEYIKGRSSSRNASNNETNNPRQRMPSRTVCQRVEGRLGIVNLRKRSVAVVSCAARYAIDRFASTLVAAILDIRYGWVLGCFGTAIPKGVYEGDHLFRARRSRGFPD